MGTLSPTAQERSSTNGHPTSAASVPAMETEIDNVPRSKASRPKKPNYAQIHSRPLPLEVHPLPAFIPHNPLSIVRIALALISQSVRQPRSHEVSHRAYFSTETQSIHVTDPQSIRALWEQGFWGTGSLSRSEPRWLDQEKRRRGIIAKETSEEATRRRREERRMFKLERAQKEREAIEQQLREEGKLDMLRRLPEIIPETDQSTYLQANIPAGGGVENVPAQSTNLASKNLPANTLDNSRPEENEVESVQVPQEIQDQEHLQLTLEEGFFLQYVTSALEVYQEEVAMTASYLFRLCCVHSTFPAPDNVSPHGAIHTPIHPDNPFLLKYVVYHHFRSLGWVVRSGIKFAVDYLLYHRGPVFAHAEFALVIIPSYSHPYWSEPLDRLTECRKKESRDWWWLHRINRVQTQVHKTLMLVYVEIPPPWDIDNPHERVRMDIGAVLKRYKVREFILRRWTPNRHRD